MPGLIGRFGDDRDDPAAAATPGSLRDEYAFAADPIRTGPRPSTTDAENAQVVEQMRERRAVTGLSRRDQDHQRWSVSVDEVMDLRRQTAAGAADRVVRRLAPRIRVIRPSTLCGG